MLMLRTVALAAAFSMAGASIASAQNVVRPAEGPQKPGANSDPARPQDQTFDISHSGEATNARINLGIGLGLPGFLAFQAGYASFGAIAPGLYMDLRLTGTTLGEAAFGTGSPLWQNSFEVDLRAGYGSRKIDRLNATIRDSNGQRVDARIPGTFGVSPYIGWRGRWGYRVQQFRLGLHVERSTNVEVEFTDGRRGDNFSQWAFDFEISVSGNEMKGLGAQAGFDQWFNQFIFLRYQLGYTHPNMKKFYPEAVNHYTGQTEINGAHGLTAQVLLNFAFQFDLPDVTQRSDSAREARQETLSTREHPRYASSTSTRASEAQPAQESPASDAARDAARSAASATAAGSASAAPITRPRPCNLDADCSDGVFCNGEETCNAGTCQPGVLPDDGVSCTQLICDEERREFRFEPLHGLCGDGNFCNGTERCDVNQGCVAGTPVPTDDGNPCTRDWCDEENARVVNEPITGCDLNDAPTAN